MCPQGFAPSHTVFQDPSSPSLLEEVAALRLEMLQMKAEGADSWLWLPAQFL